MNKLKKKLQKIKHQNSDKDFVLISLNDSLSGTLYGERNNSCTNNGCNNTSTNGLCTNNKCDVPMISTMNGFCTNNSKCG